ncbi:alpha-glucosidase (family GH31 glycosyl hydrolase) [Pedobacter sp. UYEF25]
MKKQLLFFFCSSFLFVNFSFGQAADSVRLQLIMGEKWWGGLSSQGYKMPYDLNSDESYDLWGNNYENQAESFLLSNKGRYIWSEQPIKYIFKEGVLTVTTRVGKITAGKVGVNLRDVYQFAVKKIFPPSGKIPSEMLFIRPQFNTWIELQYNQNEVDILNYAKQIVDNGYAPGVLMLDDTWQENYGVWDFSPRRFKDPKAMMEKLHTMGFKVMLWVCPFISADSKEFRALEEKGLLLKNREKAVRNGDEDKSYAAIIRWWNGASACLDLSNPQAEKWFKGKLDYLQTAYNVDGFKFDAGDARFYSNVSSFIPGVPNDQTTNFAKIGLAYPLNEYRASWKMAGLPLAQRLSDKGHSWADLQKLIPEISSQSLMGYAYTCPDLIGGGQFSSFTEGAKIDGELIVRSAQVHALMPMMQFSVAPWRVLSKKNQKLCLEAAKLHEKMGPLILELAKNASITGEPIVSPMALAFPDNGYEEIKDQFMLGKNILVAPAVEKQHRRKVILPKGTWKSDKGEIIKGDKTIQIEVPLDRLPYFSKVK